MNRQALQMVSQDGETRESADAAVPEIQVFERVSALPASCQALFDVAERESFDLGAEWFRLLQDTALASGCEPCFYVLSLGGQPRCIVPLLVKGRQVTGLTTFYTSLYRPLLAPYARAQDLAVLFRRVVKERGAAALRFDAMDPAHPSYALTRRALRLAGLQACPFFSFGNWHLAVGGRTFDAYFSGLESRTRNTVKRRGKKFAASGGRLAIMTGDEALEPAIEAWDRIYRSSWKRPEPYPAFMPGLIRLCANKRWLRLGFAYYNDVPIAAQLWIVNHGRAAIYKLAYDEAYAQHSAGSLLTAHLMRHVIDVDRVDEIDYLIGDDAYKKEWMSLRRERWGIVAYNVRTLRGFQGFALQTLGEIRRRWTAKSGSCGTADPSGG